MNCWFILLKYVLDSFCYCHDLFLISKICMLSTSFFKWKLICIFLRCKFEFFSNKKPICVFLRCRFEFLSNQKLIWIFLRYRSEFFSNKNLLASSLDADLNFLKLKKKKMICVFIRCRSKIFKHKLICIFLRYKFEFFLFKKTDLHFL